MLFNMVHLIRSPMVTKFKMLLLSTPDQPISWLSDHQLSPLAIATRILYVDGADIYIQVQRVDYAYGFDE